MAGQKPKAKARAVAKQGSVPSQTQRSGRRTNRPRRAQPLAGERRNARVPVRNVLSGVDPTLFDAFRNQGPVPEIQSSGYSVCVPFRQRLTLSSHTTQRVLILLEPRNNLAMAAAFQDTGTHINSFIPGTVTNPFPLTASVARLSLRIKVTTELLSVGGSVRILRLHRPAALVMNVTPDATGTSVTDVIDYVDSHPRTRTYGMSELLPGLQIDTVPQDMASWSTYVTTSTAGGAAFIQGSAMTALTPIAIVVPVAPSVQTFEVSIAGVLHSRYDDSGQVLANLNRPRPHLNADRFDRSVHLAESKQLTATRGRTTQS